jgi:hypothetical protein
MADVNDSDILRRARKLIVSGRRIMICHAIAIVRVPAARRKALIDWITGMMDGPSSYTTWLMIHHPRHFARGGGYRGDFREARLQWLDWMIAECEKEEAGHG